MQHLLRHLDLLVVVRHISVNSPLFDNIFDWATFKQKLRVQFRGTCSSGNFYRLLYKNRLLPGQAPLDFYLALEGIVYQGYRDYPGAIGEPEELLSRVFLQGLPSWLREVLAIKEEVECKNCIY